MVIVVLGLGFGLAAAVAFIDVDVTCIYGEEGGMGCGAGTSSGVL